MAMLIFDARNRFQSDEYTTKMLKCIEHFFVTYNVLVSMLFRSRQL